MLVPAPLRCPISLESPPLCPQITPCGHVFSFPAIMAHLMTHGGDALRKASPCPLCTAPIVSRELRLVRAHIVEPPQVRSFPVWDVGSAHAHCSRELRFMLPNRLLRVWVCSMLASACLQIVPVNAEVGFRDVS